MKKANKAMLAVGSVAVGLLFAGTTFAGTAIDVSAAAKTYEGILQKLETSSAEDALEKSKKFNETIGEEGFVLLKNENNALPLKEGSRKVNLLGKNWVNPAYGGSGSSSFDANSGSGIDVFSALEAEGFTYNKDLKTFYGDKAKSGEGRPSYSYGASNMITGETPIASYSEELLGTLENYKDANIVMVSRVGGEGYEVTNFYEEGATSNPGNTPVEASRKNYLEEHYLMLDDNEKEVLKLASEKGGKKVILVINAAQPLELHEEDIALCDAILWVGLPGSTGFAALPRILSGKVNPSGRTVDTYAKDFWSIPAYQNFSLNQEGEKRQDPGNSSSPIVSKGNGVYSADGSMSSATVVTYEEGIYVGYRYFETRAFVEDDNDKWYNENVNYPFGYGLSYTTFEYTNVNFKTSTIEKDGTVEVEVTVKNTGSVAGKEVVQLYYSAPYYDNEIEKSHVVLGDFAKTKEIAPQATDTVTLKIRVKDMASYDFNDLNDNGYKTFELDEGDYTFYVGSNAHAWYQAKTENKKTITLDEGYQYEIDIDENNDHNDNQFDDVSKGLKGEGIEVLSRMDFEGTMPTHPDKDERTADAATITKLTTYGIYGTRSQDGEYSDPTGENYDKDQPWYTDKMPTQAQTELKGDEEGIIKLLELADKDYDDPMWDQFLNQFTVQQLVAFVEQGYFTTQAVEALGIPESKNPDGPFGFVFQAPGHSSNRCYFCSPCIVAATFNKEIARRQGEFIGEDGAWMGYNGIYGPGVNIHRTPFSGRNFEYYSEDATLAATMCREVVAGMQSRGVMPYIKHFALNDQEQDRNGVATYANEQTIREIYLRAFQWAVEDSKALGIMSSFNRIGTTWTGASYPLLTNVLRKEWGFRGIVVTDWANGGYMNLDQMIRAGNDLSLSARGQHVGGCTEPLVPNEWGGMSGPDYSDPRALTPTHVAAMRQATKNICYAVLHTCEMGKLTEYDELCVNDSYKFYADGSDLTIDFHSEVYETYCKAQGYTVEYEITKPDAIVRSEAEKGNNSATNAEQLPAANVSIDKTSGIVTIKHDGLKAQKYSLCVSIKITKDDQSNYIGQSAQTIIDVLEIDADEYVQQLEAKITELEAQVEDLETQIGVLRSQLNTLNTTVTELTQRIDALEKAGGGDSGDSSEEIKALQTTVATLNSTIETLQGTITSLQSDLKAAQDKIAALEKAGGSEVSKDDLKKLEDSNKQLQDQIKDLESKIKDLQNSQNTTEQPKEGGCGGVIGLGSALVAAVTVLGGAAIVLKKRK